MNDSTNRISGLLSPTDGAAQGSTTPAPAVSDRTDPRHTTVINSDRPIVSVQFAEDESDGRWFRLLNWLVDSGAWARISDPAGRLLIVLARHARSSDGTSLPSLETMQQQTGLARATVFKARAELVSTSLIRETPHGAWELFPGRPFAQRKPAASPPPETPSLPRWTPPARQSTAVDSKSPAVDSKSLAVDPLKRLKTEDVDVDRLETAGGGDDGDELLRELQRNGFNRKDSADFVERFGLEKAANALANALYLKSTGKLKSSVKACAWNSAQRGYGLFAEVEQERRKRDARSLIGRLKTLPFRRVLEAHEFDLLSSAFPKPEKLAASGLFTSAEIQDLDDAAAVWLIFDRVAEHAGVGGRHPASS